MPAWRTWPFQSPHGIRNSDPGILAVTARSWSENRSLTSSLRPLYQAYTDRKVTTSWLTISFTKIILSETLCSSKTFSIHSSATNTPTPAVPLFLVSFLLIVRQLPPRYLVFWIQQTSTFLQNSVSTTSQTLPLRVFTLSVPILNFLSACLISHNCPTLPPTPDRRPSWKCYQQNFDVCWHSLTQILLWSP